MLNAKKFYNAIFLELTNGRLICLSSSSLNEFNGLIYETTVIRCANLV